jgi:hypothetical protein
LFDGINDVKIYDYVDIYVRIFEKMYQKRLNGYASIGYNVEGESIGDGNTIDIIFNSIVNGANVVIKSNIHQKFEVVDH